MCLVSEMGQFSFGQPKKKRNWPAKEIDQNQMDTPNVQKSEIRILSNLPFL